MSIYKIFPFSNWLLYAFKNPTSIELSKTQSNTIAKLLIKIETLVDYCGPVPYYRAILLEQISIPEDNDYGKHKNNDTF
ncbi:MAG: hypothetical protein ACYSUY_10685, partial [Planctomycetota bacterium]